MKKLNIKALLFISLVMLVGCSQDESAKEEVYEDNPSIVGLVTEVEDESIIIDSRDRVFSGNLMIARPEDDKDDADVTIGDLVMVYYDGKITEADPSRIKETYSIIIKEKADNATKEVESAENPADVAKKDSGDENYFHSLPNLTSVKGDKTIELSDNQSAFVHNLISDVKWDKGAKEDIKEDYSIMDGSQTLITFNSETHMLNDKRNDISIQLEKNLSDALKLILDDKL